MMYRYIIYILFLLSGATGLVYEVLWHRKLTLIFGSTVYAASTILSVFFSGLALGAYLIGRSVDRGRYAISMYAVLEGLIGTFGICSPLLLSYIDDIYLRLVPHLGSGIAGITAARFVLAYLVLLLPTTLMGATLPVLVKLVSESDCSVSFNAGRLYGVNTIGAAIGAFLAAIVLVPLFGVNESIYLTGTLNVLIGTVAFFLFRKQYRIPFRSYQAASPARTPAQNYLLAFFCVAGFISMVYQVAWLRVLFQISGSSVYAFGLILSVFIVGLGLGSEVTTRFLMRIPSVIMALIFVEAAASLYTLFLVNYYDRLPLLYTYLRTSFGFWEFGGSFAINIAIISVMILFPTLLFGAAFPLLAAGYARAASTSGGDVGAVYAVNTIGGVIGSFVGGFFLLPHLGSQATVLSMAVTGLVLSMGLAFLVPKKIHKIAIVSLCVCAIALAGTLHRPWDPRLIDSAPYITHYSSVREQTNAKRNDRLMYYKEGVNVNVSVFGDYQARVININGKPMATVVLTDKSNQYLLGHLPMLLHPDPKNSLVIGLGAGMTFSALVRHGEPADVVEISPEVVDGALLFRKHNRSVLDQP
ncbi:MAG: fused MFS/spermidine synthase, partial [Nitrospirota bacterium]|nr:fused MFS/spermidine synthase [Nitrospirota bacterium]